MYKSFLTFVAGCFLSIAPAMAQHSINADRQVLNLAGAWKCSLGSINLPTTISEARLGQRNTDTTVTANLTQLYPFVGRMTYQRMIDIPQSMAGKKIRLFMERTKPSTLWIDNDSIGHQTQLLTPHIYDISNLKPGRHLLTILIDNSESLFNPGVLGSHALAKSTQTNWNGILGKFFIESLPQTYIDRVEVYPDVKNHQARVDVTFNDAKAEKGKLLIEGYAWNTAEKNTISPVSFQTKQCGTGIHTATYMVDMGEKPSLWSEFNPALYHLKVTYIGKKGNDSKEVDFGMRDFSTNGSHFTVNGTTIYLRGSHDGCVFPLTAYAPMDTASWMRYFRTLKEYGFNHVRFHSWTPPEAAFEAADRMGFYLQPERPYWGGMSKKNTQLNDYLGMETDNILAYYGNHPSFTMFALGNELHGDIEYMRELLDNYRNTDSRHLYAFGSNNYLGSKGYQQGEDYFVTCRNGYDADTTFSTHVRASFSFADAYQGGIINGLYPNTTYTYTKAIGNCPIPIVSHESGQFQIYPDYDEIKKYTGVLYPYNFEIFRNRLKTNNLEKQAIDFHQATRAFSALCYKADMELCLRTPGMGGTQILDIKDYSGQGSALVGLLDAFMDSKGAVSSDEFRMFNSPVAVMAEFPSYCWSSDDTMTGRVVISNYSDRDLKNVTLTVKLQYSSQSDTHSSQSCTHPSQSDESGNDVAEPIMKVISAPMGGVTEIASYDIPLTKVKEPTMLTLSLEVAGYRNDYHVWVYPKSKIETKGIVTATKLTDSLLRAVEKGAKVLFIPRHQDIEKQSVGGLFTPDYWNYAMFKSISENNKKPVSPGTLSILVNPHAALFKEFPTEIHSDWQWWAVCRNSRPMILDHTDGDYQPLVQVVDNVERNHKLGLLFEFAIGKGRILVSTCDLNVIQDKPEGSQFVKAIYDYMRSSDFRPALKLTKNEFQNLFVQNVTEQKIIGEKNITTYK